MESEELASWIIATIFAVLFLLFVAAIVGALWQLTLTVGWVASSSFLLAIVWLASLIKRKL